ncbi:MAG: hypothetical protein WCP23_13130 [Planctomycetota bacterium]
MLGPRTNAAFYAAPVSEFLAASDEEAYALLVAPWCVIPIQFNVNAKKFDRLDYEQAWDYGLDLKNFHAPSHAAPIFPILCATEARDSDLPPLNGTTSREIIWWC